MYRPAAKALVLAVFLFVPASLLAQQPATTPAQNGGQATASPTPTPDPNDPLVRLKDEGLNRSQVMATLSYLSDVIGPRLTGSPNLKRANEWTRDQLSKWGLQNAHLESWGPFGRGWALKSFFAEVIAPQGIPLIAYPKAWSPGTNIPSGDVVFLDAKDQAGLARLKGNLRGKIVLAGSMREIKAHFDPPGNRLSEKDLLAL